jgi:hypothetical protein
MSTRVLSQKNLYETMDKKEENMLSSNHPISSDPTHLLPTPIYETKTI